MRKPPRPRLSTLVAAALYAGVTVVFTRPLIFHVTDRMVSFWGDPMLNAYVVAWNQHALLHRPAELLHPNFLYPMPYAIALSENLLLPSLLTLPLAAFGNPVLVYNVLFLASFAASAMALYLVLRAWGVGVPAAWAGGLIFGFLPWRYGQLSHAQLLYTWWIPPALWAADRWLRKGGYRSALLAAGWLVAGFATCVYEFYFLALFLVAFGATTLIGAVRRGERIRPRLREGAAAAVLAAAMLAPLVPAYRATAAWLNNPNPQSLLKSRGAALTDYLRVAGDNALWGPVLRWKQPYSDVGWEHLLFPGLLPLVLAAALPFVARRQRETTDAGRGRAGALAAGGILLFVVSLGPRVHAHAAALGDNPVYRTLYAYLPGFAALRVPPRAALLVGLMLAALAALTLDRAARGRSGKRSRLRSGIPFAAGVLLLAELFPRPIAVEASQPYARHRSVHATVAQRPPGVVLVLPLDQDTKYVSPLAATVHFYPLITGISGYLPSSNGAIFHCLEERPWGDDQLRLLRWLDVRYIVVDLESDPGGMAHVDELETLLAGAGLLASRTDRQDLGMALLERRSEGRLTPPRTAEPMNVSLSHSGGPRGGGPVHACFRNEGTHRWISAHPRRLDVSVRGLDARGDSAWERTVQLVLPPFWLTGQELQLPLEIPRGRDADTAVIELSVTDPLLAADLTDEIVR